MNAAESGGRERHEGGDYDRDVGQPANRVSAALKQLRIARQQVDDDDVDARLQSALREVEAAAERLRPAGG